MNRIAISALVLAALSACAPAVPDSAAGVGFDDYTEYLNRRAARDAALEAQVTVRPPPSQDGAPLSAIPGDGAAASADGAAESGPSSIEQIASAALSETGSGQAPLDASPSNPPPLQLDNPGLSDENDFDAVSGRRGIESDAERLARAQAQYQVIRPTPLPEREGDNGPNIVQYALQSANPVGQRIYRRTGLNQAQRQQRACGQFASPDLAQVEFLRRGGPERDRLGLDPDGDGYACDWNPAPFRRAVQG